MDGLRTFNDRGINNSDTFRGLFTVCWLTLGMSQSRLRLLQHRHIPLYAFTKPYNLTINKDEGKGKQSRYRPSVAQRVPRGLGSQIFMTFGT